ncbi:CoaE Dephospho-CoA kinase [Burkholderiaceae bacterium]
MVESIHSFTQLKGKIPFLGLTGGIGSGKSSVANFLAKKGAAIIDTDQIAHQITGPDGLAIGAILQEFGAGFIASDGSLNRSKMRELVFSNPSAKRSLENITHPLIRQETLIQAKKAIDRSVPYIVFVVPLLLESGAWTENLDHIAVVDCPDELRIQRVMQRSKLDRATILGIIANQAGREDRLAIANTILNNDGDLSSLEAQSSQLHQKMLDL